MPLIQYFGCAGSLLLAALVAASWCFPAADHAPSSELPLDEKISIRIHIARKWPERVQFDTTHPAALPSADAGPADADVAPDQRLAGAGQQGPLVAFAEMTPRLSRQCFRPPCATRHLTEQEASPGEKGAPSQNRSRLSITARKDITFPNPLHKPPGRS